MGDQNLHKTSSYLDVQRKLVKEKLAKRIQNDRDDYKYAQKNRAALAGGTGVLVLLSVFAFGILELDFGLPMVSKGFEHAMAGSFVTGNDRDSTTKAAVDTDLLRDPLPMTHENPFNLADINIAVAADPEPAPEELFDESTEDHVEVLDEPAAPAEDKPAPAEDKTKGGAGGDKSAPPASEAKIVPPASEAENVPLASDDKLDPAAFIVDPDLAPKKKGKLSVTMEQLSEEEEEGEDEGDSPATTGDTPIKADQATAGATGGASNGTAEEKPQGVVAALLSALPFIHGHKTPAALPKGPSKNVNDYPMCNHTVITKSESEMDFMTQKVAGGTVFSEPFPSSLYVCNFWPEALYSRMNYFFPPEAVFDKLVSKEKQKKCGKGGCHHLFKMDTLKKADNATLGNWPKFAKAKKVWEKFETIVFSKRFEAALFEQLKVKVKPGKRQIHFLSDKHGYTDGTVKTTQGELGERIATMHFFIINNTAAEQDYGVCVHTEKQYKDRQVKKTSPRKVKGKEQDGVGEAACEKMFRFLPNSGVAIKTTPRSYHSAPNYFRKHHQNLDRNVIVVDWYK